MIAVEEVRVNMALTQLGFDLSGLTDNNEDADGEYCAIHEQWDAAVRFAVGTAGTGGGKKFLVGVRRHNKKWADALAKIQKRVLKELASAEKKRNNLYSTRVSRSGIAPEGFLHVERLGEYIDRLTEHPPQEEAPTQADATSGETAIASCCKWQTWSQACCFSSWQESTPYTTITHRPADACV